MNTKCKGRVLIIDKYHNTLGPLIGSLEDAGYIVILAIKIKEAQAVLANKDLKIDCTIINVIEPIKETIFDYLSTLINPTNHLKVPLVVYSSRLPIDIAKNLFEIGILQIIEKPCSTQSLTSSIINLIDLKNNDSSHKAQQNDRYQAIMSSTPMEVAIINPSHKILEWNTTFEAAITDVNIGDNFFELCCGDDFKELNEHPVIRSIETKKIESGNISIITEHHQRFLNVIATPILDKNEEIETILIQTIDQTSQIVMEKKLRRQVQSFNRILKEQDRTTDYLISVQKDLQKKGAELEKLSITDYLTGVDNRRQFNKDLKIEALRAARYNHPLSLLLLDIDNFKVVNDTYGHPFGDTVLKSLTTVLQLSTRDTDIISRYGGEEFALILPETDHDTALIVSERIRNNVENRKMSSETGEVSITISIGLATIESENIDPDKVVQLSDECLYEAKRSGKNKICSVNFS